MQIGGVYPSHEIPDGAMVRDEDGDFAVRSGDWGEWVKIGSVWYDRDPTQSWKWRTSPRADNRQWTLIALGLTGKETADTLRTVAGYPRPIAEGSNVEVLVAELAAAARRIAELEAEVTRLTPPPVRPRTPGGCFVCDGPTVCTPYGTACFKGCAGAAGPGWQ